MKQTTSTENCSQVDTLSTQEFPYYELLHDEHFPIFFVKTNEMLSKIYHAEMGAETKLRPNITSKSENGRIYITISNDWKQRK
ncbi:CLUMA_CG003907, isoform A [Clunio marinus]|uniref:CLUMA_CG003907, isoform A n=1 Tax=Clunio marinus TaxID=568069 RepID=A0A1J1HVL7_9DIPT|nr:CLUMA_CG003907, isoform A [Clunio marinus]